MKHYRDLVVWQKSFDLVKLIYELTKKMPESEKYGLSSQMQRFAVSIPSNLAEGQQRNSKKEFVQFISIARGSTAELCTQLQLVQDIYNIDCNELITKTEEIGKMLYALMRKLR